MTLGALAGALGGLAIARRQRLYYGARARHRGDAAASSWVSSDCPSSIVALVALSPTGPSRLYYLHLWMRSAAMGLWVSYLVPKLVASMKDATMKTLMLLRHAKSSWKDSDLADHERPLNKRGKKTAPQMGRLLSTEGLVPDLILSSTAVRARETAEAVAKSSGYEGPIELLESLYLAPPGTLLSEAQSRTPDSVGVFSSSRTIQGWRTWWKSSRALAHPFPTAALAVFEVGIERWKASGARSRDEAIEALPAEGNRVARYSFSFSSRSSVAMSMKSRSVTMPMSRPSFTTGRDPMRRSFMRRMAS